MKTSIALVALALLAQPSPASGLDGPRRFETEYDCVGLARRTMRKLKPKIGDESPHSDVRN